LVRTYNAGLSFALLLFFFFLLLGVINQNTAIFANFVQFHHAFRHSQNIALLSNFTMHSAALLGSLAQQPCPAVRPISTEFDARARSAVTALYYSGRSPNCMRALLS
jgi:hypothetical protein